MTELEIPSFIRQAFPPDRDGLMEALCMLMTSDMLVEISHADYGSDSEEHLAGLKKIWKDRGVVGPLTWEPLEVLDLIKWSEPDVPNWHPAATGSRGHAMRAFCCAALLQSVPFGAEVNCPDTVIGLVQSVITIGDDLPEMACKFLCWGLESLELFNDAFGVAYALVCLSALVLGDSLTEADADLLAAFVDALETATRSEGAESFTIGSQRPDAWNGLSAEVRCRFPRFGDLVTMTNLAQAKRWDAI